MREYQVRFCEGLGVKFPGPTRRHSCNTWSTMSDCHSFSDFDALSNVMG
jgi:hypothetical protein